MAEFRRTGFVDGAAAWCPPSSRVSARIGADGQPKTVYVVGPDLTRMAEGAPSTDQFLPAYEAQFGTRRSRAFHAYAYDATDIVLDAIQLAATRYKDGTITIGRSALRDAVFGTKDYQGVTGTLSCTPLAASARRSRLSPSTYFRRCPWRVATPRRNPCSPNRSRSRAWWHHRLRPLEQQTPKSSVDRLTAPSGSRSITMSWEFVR